MSNNYFCTICNVRCNSQVTYEQHTKSAKHIKNCSQASSKQANSITSQTVIKDVQKSSSTVENQNNSFDISAETMRILIEWNHPNGYKPYCDLCHLPLYGENNADTHFQTNNIVHFQRLAIWKQIQDNNPKYSCLTCSEIFPNENRMLEHLESSLHFNMIEEKSYVRKIILIYETYCKLKEYRRESKNVPSTTSDTVIVQMENLKITDDKNVKPKTNGIWIIPPDEFIKTLKNQTERNVYDDDDDG